jgi:flagellin
MSLSVLNNIPSLVAQNQLQITNTNLQNTLFQLSSGSRINTGADDAAGLAIANGLQANISALQQSSLNASDGVGKLQVADGALSQVTTLLNRAVTLATESANGTVSQQQRQALNAEFVSIQAEINRIGAATNFNGTPVFSTATVANPNQVASTSLSNVTATTALTPTDTTTVALGTGAAYTFTPGTAASTLYTGAQAVTAGSQIANGATLSVANTGGTFNFTANPLNYTGETGGLNAATVTTLANATLSVTNASGTVTYAGGPLNLGDWLVGFNAVGASKGISASLNGGHLVISSNSGITAVAAGTDITGVAGALTAGTNTEEYTGATGLLNNLSPTTLNDNLTVVNGGITTTYNGGAASTVGAWIIGFNAAAVTAGSGLVASLNAGGSLQILGTSPITSVTASAANIADFGALTATQTPSPDTVGDLMTQINNSGFGLTASIDGNNHLNINSSNGNITISNNTAIQLGALTATSTVQNLIDGINASGLGLTAGLANQTNQLVGPTAVTANTVVALGDAMTISSGTAPNVKSYTYTAAAATTVGAMIAAIQPRINKGT